MLALPPLPPIKPGCFFGLCNALLDITAEVEPSYLQKYGLLPNNAILADDKTRPITDEIVTNYSVSYTAGGAGQNTMRAAQWKLPPGSTVYVSCIGQDHFATILENEARADGVDVHYRVNPSLPTGTCATLLTDRGHHRSLIANLGAALSLSLDYIKENVSLLQQAHVFYVTGFMMNVSLESVLYIAEHAFHSNKIFALNLSAPFVCQFYGKELMQAYQYADLVFGNECELHEFAILNNLPETDPSELVRSMALLSMKSSCGRLVIITRGAMPTLVSDGHRVESFPVPYIPSEEIIDANGAGDAFVGGFMAAYILGRPLAECIDLGHQVAGHILRTSGIVFR